MKTTKILAILVLGMMVCAANVSEAAPMGTAITYQGRLMDANSVADGEYDFEFSLYDDPCSGSPIAGPVNEPNLNVIDGYFTLALDFGSVFNGDARWLETAVRPGDSNDPNAFVTLSPRTELTPVPYALQTRGIFVDDAGNVGIGTTNPLSKLSVGGDGIIDAGVYGSGNTYGVYGSGTSVNGLGVFGIGNHSGVRGESATTGSYGILGYGNCGGWFHGNGYFSGIVVIDDNVTIDGQLSIPHMMSYPWPAGGSNVKIYDNKLFYESSSARYKENIQLCREEFSKILQAQPKSYTCRKTGRRAIGFIAEEFDELGLCELVIYDQEGRPDGIAYQLISLYLLEVLKDEVKTMREQEEAINQLEEKNRSLEERVDVLERMMQRQHLAVAKEVQK